MTTLLWMLLTVAPVQTDLHLKEAPPAEVGFDASRLAAIDAVVEEGIKAKKMPGCVVLVARQGRIAFFKAYGKKAVEPNDEPMTKDAMFDLASITKPVATASSVMHLVERGVVRLGDELADTSRLHSGSEAAGHHPATPHAHGRIHSRQSDVRLHGRRSDRA